MAFPTSILQTPAVAVEGMPANTNHLRADSKVAQAAIAPGRAVCFHAADNTALVRAPAATGEVTANGSLAGVTMFDATALTNPYAANDPLPVVNDGDVWVLAEEAVSPSDPVFIRFANTGSGAVPGVPGCFRKSADTATAVAAPAGWRFLTSTSGAGLVQLRVRTP